MQIPFAVVADDASVSTDGKLNITGVFDHIRAVSFPAVHARMVFVFSLRAGFEDSMRRLELLVRLVDEDGLESFRGQAELTVPEIAPGGRKTLNQIFKLQMARFVRAGEYKFVIEVRGGAERLRVSETPFSITRIEP